MYILADIEGNCKKIRFIYELRQLLKKENLIFFKIPPF